MSEQDEPSMEDILSSIRKILSDDLDEVEASPEPAPEPVVEPAPEPVYNNIQTETEEDVVNLTRDMEIREEMPKAAPLPPHNHIPSTQELISPPVQHVTACKLAEFAKFMAEEKVAYMGNGKITIEQLIKELLRPMLKEWLDTNLEGVVEKMVEKEIQRVGDKIKLF